MTDTKHSSLRSRLRLHTFLPVHWIILVVIAVAGIAGSLLIGLSPAITIALLLVVVVGTIVFSLYRTRTQPDETMTISGFLVSLVSVAALTLIVLNLIPGTRGISHPPVTAEPNWAGDSKSALGKQTRALAVRACYDCHSNQTKEPWYSNFAPVSMALQEHVEEGRAALNFSEWDREQEGADEAVNVLKEGSMPPAYFTRLGRHPEAKLTDAERQKLMDGLAATPGIKEHLRAGGEG